MNPPDQLLAPGLWGVLATPFQESSLAIDDDSMRRQLQLHLAVGSTGLVVLGVFGEAASLNADEQAHIVDLVTRESGGLPVIIGLAARDTGTAIASAQRLLEAAGGVLPSLMCQIPSSDPQTLAAHLNELHDATGAGIVVQDYPVVSGVDLTTSQLLNGLAKFPHAVAIKSEAPPTPPAIAQLTAATSVPVFGGLGGLGLLDELMAGAAGAMTGFSHPEGLAAALRAWDLGGYVAAREAFMPWLALVNFEAQVGVGLAIRKFSLCQRGVFDSAAVRPPAVSMPTSLVPLLDSHLSALNELRVA